MTAKAAAEAKPTVRSDREVLGLADEAATAADRPRSEPEKAIKGHKERGRDEAAGKRRTRHGRDGKMH